MNFAAQITCALPRTDPTQKFSPAEILRFIKFHDWFDRILGYCGVFVAGFVAGGRRLGSSVVREVVVCAAFEQHLHRNRPPGWSLMSHLTMITACDAQMSVRVKDI